MAQTSKSSSGSVSKDGFSLPRWLPYLIFALTTLFFFKAHIFGNSFFWEDFTEQVYPNRAFAAKNMAEGNIPFWNPYSFGGMPFMADVQSALFYPPNLILDSIVSTNPYSVKSLQILIILHFFLAQIGMYVLMRKLGVSMLGSMISSIAYGFSSPLVLHIFHPMQVEHLAWFPLIVRWFYQAIKERDLIATSIAGLITGITFLSGSPQMTLYIAFFLGCMLLWITISSLIGKKSTPSQVISSLGLGALSLAIGVGIFCIQYLPSKELASLSERNEMTFEKASAGSLEFKQIITSVVPKAYGHITPEGQNKAPYYLSEREYYLYWDTAFFFGCLTMFLGLFGVIASGRNPTTLFFGVMSLFGFLFALGSNGFVFPIFYNLPFFGSLRIPARMMFYVSFGMSVLAGFGFDALSKNLKTTPTLYKLLGAWAVPTFFALGVSTGSIIEIPEQMKETISSFASTALFFMIAGLALAYTLHRGILKSWLAGSLFLLLIFIDLYSNSGTFNVAKQNPVREYQDGYSAELRGILQPNPPKDIFRVSMRAPGVMAMKRNQGLVDNVMLFEGYNQLLLAKRHPAVPTATQVHDLLAMRYEIGIDSIRRSASFIRRQNPFPHAWMVYSSQISSESGIKETMKDTSIDYRNTVVLEESTKSSLSNKKSTEVNHKLECVDYNDNSYSYSVSTDENGILCLSDIWYPAWVAYIDGVPAKVYRANYCLRAVEIPAGNHKVELRYESTSFKQGALYSMLSFAVAVGCIVVAQVIMMKNRKNQNDA